MSNKVAPEGSEYEAGGAATDAEPSEDRLKPALPAWGHILVLLSVGVPTAAFTFVFSVMGMGDVVYEELVKLENEHSLWAKTTGAAFVLLFGMFVLDASYWTGALFIGWILGAWVPTSRYDGCIEPEHAEMCWEDSVQVSCWQDCWTNFWGSDIKRFWRWKLGCARIYDEALCESERDLAVHPSVYTHGGGRASRAAPIDGGADDGCEPSEDDMMCWTAAFLWWCFPGVVVMTLLVYSLVCHFLWRVLASSKKSAGTQAAVRLFGFSIVIFTGGVWVSTSIAATSLSMTNVIIMGLFIFTMVTSALVGSTLGWANIRRSAGNLKVKRKLDQMGESSKDYGRAFFICFASPILLLYLVLSFLNQLSRKYLPFTKDPDGGRNFTRSTTEALDHAKRWNWGSVASKMTFWGVFYMVLQVLVTKAVFIFFSFFNEQLETLAPLAVCFIFFVVGVVMFTIPVVPGVPVYVTAGILIPASYMNRDPGPEWKGGDTVPASFWTGMAVACVVVFFVKLVAVAMEQEGIGRFMGKLVAVRAMVGVNSIEMKATRMILSKPGLSVPKCTILVGGPDWPTSVLTGILRLSCVQMLIGTVPIALLVVPSTAAGGFLLINAISEVYASLSTVVTMVAMATQFAALVGAVWVIDRYATEHKAELEALPIDAEVARLDATNAARTAAWRIVTRWDTPGTPKWPHVLISLGAVSLTAACFLNVFLTCWEEFQISDTIDEKLGGNALNIIIMPKGHLVIFGFALGWLLRYIFLKWASAEAKRYLEQHPELHAAAEGASVPVTAAVSAGAAGLEMGSSTCS